MTRQDLLSEVQASMARAAENVNPLWHDIGGIRRAVGQLPTHVLQHALMLEPMASDPAFKPDHESAVQNAHHTVLDLPYPRLEGLEKGLMEGLTDG